MKLKLLLVFIVSGSLLANNLADNARKLASESRKQKALWKELREQKVITLEMLSDVYKLVYALVITTTSISSAMILFCIFKKPHRHKMKQD